jgi:hypothetical protein
MHGGRYLLEARLKAKADAEAAAGSTPFAYEVDYGERAEHCWNGDQARQAPPRSLCSALYLVSLPALCTQ